MQTRTQQYAADAYVRVQFILEVKLESKEREKKYRDQYGSMAHKLPILIRQAGLAQALAFIEARGEDAHKRLLNDVTATIRCIPGIAAMVGQNTLGGFSRTASLTNYILLTAQVLETLLWYKRFAQSILDVDDAGTGESA